MRNTLSIIWNMTTLCPYQCPICCMDAQSSCEKITNDLSYGTKYAVVGQLRKLSEIRDIRMDLSGGEIMTDLRNLDIAEEISHIIHKENLGISTSGHGITEEIAVRLASIVSEVELTMDTLPGVQYKLRPLSYAIDAAKAVPLLKKQGVRTGIQTVLARSNSNVDNLSSLYNWLCCNHVDEWSLLRFYPSGRGADFPEECLNEDELSKVIHIIQKLDAENPALDKPKLHFHYTMKGHSGYTAECRCVKKSIGIFPDGNVTACFWASDKGTKITDERFYLGNIQEETLFDILSGPRADYWQNRPHYCPLAKNRKESSHVSTTKYTDCIA